MEDLFIAFLQRSEKLRPGYVNSLGKATSLPEVIYDVRYPELLKVIYQQVSGTKSNIIDQKYMDFIPGYYLIHIDEYGDSLELQKQIVEEFSDKRLIPILRNYSSDFVSLDVDSGSIYLVYHDDDEIYKIYENGSNFLQTLTAFYEQKVYFLDNDNYLDYDADLEYTVAHHLNPSIDYWAEQEV